LERPEVLAVVEVGCEKGTWEFQPVAAVDRLDITPHLAQIEGRIGEEDRPQGRVLMDWQGLFEIAHAIGSAAVDCEILVLVETFACLKT